MKRERMRVGEAWERMTFVTRIVSSMKEFILLKEVKIKDAAIPLTIRF